MQAATFPEAFPCPELVLACKDRYDVAKKCICAFNGEVLVYVSRVAIMGTLRIPLHEIYEDWTISSSYTKLSTDVTEFNNTIAKGWLFKYERGGSRLPCPLTREHMIPEIKDVITLLNRVKGNPHTFHWEKWTYFLILSILGEDKFIDWADIISTRLQEELSQASGISSFYMTLFFILACGSEWKVLPNSYWNPRMPIYEYYPLL